MRLWLVLVVAWLVPWTVPAADIPATHSPSLQADPFYSQVARRFTRRFPEEHLRHLPIDALISGRAWTNYITSLDGERVYFLKSDIEAFSREASTIGDELKAGNVDFAFTVYHVFMERLKNRIEYVNTLLDKEFELNDNDSYRWKRKDAPWPSDPADWNDLWRRKIENEYLQQVVAREMAASSATNSLATNTVETAVDSAKKPLLPSPRELIRQRYKQLRIVMNDNDSEWILQKYLSAFAQAYDPHSSYMSPSSMDDFDIEMKLSLVGIGALLSSEDGAAKIVELIPGGPADLDKRDSHLQPNDKIIAVADDDSPAVDILHLPLHKVVKLIRGKKGTRVVLTVIPAADPTGSTTKIVDLVRDEVKLEERAASAKYEHIQDFNGIPRHLGVITLPTFYANMKAGSVNDQDFKSSSYDVAKILQEMGAKQVDGVILDLRNNGGGSLLEAIKMVGLFIGTGPTVQVKERYSVKVLPDLDPNIYYNGPLIILVSRLSASASEIVAGALQDYGRAIIVGDTKTHGKGSVQTILDLGRDVKLGSIKITTASYYRISGGSTQLRGITSDIVIHSPFDFMELGEEYLPNAMEWNTVPPARYSTFTNLVSYIPVLTQKSEKRRSDDPRFAAYDRVLDRIKAINKTEELPLNIEERRKLAKSEKELTDLEEELEKDEGLRSDKKETGASDAKPDAKPDLVLSEGLHILADLVTLEKRERKAVEVIGPSSEKRSLGDMIVDWLRSK